MHIIRIGREVQLLLRRYTGKVLGLGGGGQVNIGRKFLRLLISLLGKIARNHIISLGIGCAQQIQRHHGKLGRRTALQEQHLIVVGNIHHPAEQRLGRGDNVIKIF